MTVTRVGLTRFTLIRVAFRRLTANRPGRRLNLLILLVFRRLIVIRVTLTRVGLFLRRLILVRLILIRLIRVMLIRPGSIRRVAVRVRLNPRG